MLMNRQRLIAENLFYHGTGGVSERNRSQHFLPAFIDRLTGLVYLSRFADGMPAPFHLLDGLPEHLLQRSSETGEVTSACEQIESGFVRYGHFYSRAEAADAVTAHLKQS